MIAPGSHRARDVMGQATLLLAQAIALGRFGVEQTQRVRSAATIHQRRCALDATSGMDLSQLGIDARDLSILRMHGIASVRDFVDGGVTTGIEKLDASIADRIEQLVQQQVVQTPATAPSPTDQRPSNLKLLRELKRLIVWQEVMSTEAQGRSVSYYSERLVAQRGLPRLLADADDAGMDSPLRLYFVPGSMRERGEAALQRLHRIVESGDKQIISSAWKLVSAPIELDISLLSEYQREAGLYTSALRSVMPSEEETRARHGDLEKPLVRRIEQQPVTAASIKVPLRGYQVFGAQFAITQQRSVLGDEMGLGKTLQALTASAHLMALNPGGGLHLVVCPASLLLNWQNEIRTKTTLKVQMLHGSRSKREAALNQWLKGGQIGLTSYGTLGKLPLPEGLRLELLVADEAHYVKNPSAQRTRTIRQVSRGAERVLFMTGTPMENNLAEFVSLVNLLQPEVAHKLRSTGVTFSSAFKRAAGPVYLRRNQSQVLRDLPELIEVDESLYFTAHDRDEYRRAVGDGNYQLMRRAAFLSDRSAKLDRLMEICEASAAEGNKTLVFSQFLDVLAAVRQKLGALYRGTIQGSVSFKDRDELLRSFASSKKPSVLLSQINAGGVGLNIQAASTVIICEPQYKPSTEVQAIARARRMGQIKPVTVHRLIVDESLDRLIRERAEEKQRIFDQFLRDAHAANVPQAKDVSEVEFQQWVIAFERQRLGLTA